MALYAAPPLGSVGEALDPLDQHPAVPAAIEHRHLTQAGQLAVEAPQEVLVLLLERRLGVRHHRVVPWVEVADERLDRAALAGRIGALHHDQQAGPERARAHQPAEVQPQLREPPLPLGKPLLVLVAVEPV